MSKRIEKAKALLANTAFSIDTIAEKSGFSEATYFYKVFRNYTGNTPNEYRKAQQN